MFEKTERLAGLAAEDATVFPALVSKQFAFQGTKSPDIETMERLLQLTRKNLNQ